MKGHGEKQTRKQEQAILALLSEPTIEAAAEACGVGQATLWRWMQLPSFQSEYRAARRWLVEASIGTLQYATTEAVETLRRKLTCGHPATEVRAATAILD